MRTALKLRSSNAYTRMKQARQDAGIPEITHTGLALDAARLLARAGHPGDAARLLWLNRDAPIGVDSVQHMLAVASVLARKAGDDTLALRCRLGAFDSAPRRADEYDYVSGPDPRILLVELPQTRKDLLEFGGKADLLDYIENHLMPTADSNQVGELLRTAPELRKARPTLFMRNTVRYGLGNIFAASVTAGNCSVIERNWAKMMAGPDSFRSCERFAAWIIASDLPLDSNRRSYTGLINTRDMLRGWTMLLQLYKRMGANDPRALTGADYMDKLLDRISGSLDDNNPNAGDDEDWWG